MSVAGKLSLCLISILAVAAAMTGCDPSQPEWYGAQDQYAVRTVLGTNSVHLGSLVNLEIDMLHPDGTKPVFTDPGDDREVIVRDRSWDSRLLEDGRRISSVRYDLTSFELGEHRILEGDLQFVRDDEVVETLEFADLLLSVESLLAAGDEDMRDIADSAAYPARFPRWLPVLLLVALLAAIAGALFARLYRRRAPAALEPVRPPADEVALKALKALRAKGWIEECRAEPFYVEISSIVRSYIENRFGLRAPEQTTEEFIREASQSDQLSLEHRQSTSEFLRQSDMVKFARYEPDEDLMTQALDSAERLVRETSSIDEPSREGGAQ